MNRRYAAVAIVTTVAAIVGIVLVDRAARDSSVAGLESLSSFLWSLLVMCAIVGVMAGLLAPSGRGTVMRGYGAMLGGFVLAGLVVGVWGVYLEASSESDLIFGSTIVVTTGGVVGGTPGFAVARWLARSARAGSQSQDGTGIDRADARGPRRPAPHPR